MRENQANGDSIRTKELKLWCRVATKVPFRREQFLRRGQHESRISAGYYGFKYLVHVLSSQELNLSTYLCFGGCFVNFLVFLGILGDK